MANLKWDISGKGDGAASGGRYSGPMLPKGSYVARVKRVQVGKIKAAGDNQGKTRLAILLEVVAGAGSSSAPDESFEYYGAPVWDGLNIIKSSTPFVNAFLHALTDGSERSKREVEHAFWDLDKKVKTETKDDGSKTVHLISFGKYRINSPEGETLVQIFTKVGTDLQKNPRPEISGYAPYAGIKAKVSTDAADDDEDQDMLDDDEDYEPDDDEDYDDDEQDDESDDGEDEEDEGDEDEPYESSDADDESVTSGATRKPPF